MSQRIHLSWLQLSHEKAKLLAAIAGVMVSVVLMWMQLGLMNALFSSAVLFHDRLNADLVVVHSQYESILRSRSFSSRLLHRLRGSEDVQQVVPVSIGTTDWKNPYSGEKKSIQVYGIETQKDTLDAIGINEYRQALREEDTFLFDRLARPGFGDIPGAIAAGEHPEVEINRRRMKAIGITELGSSFGVDGNVIVCEANFLRLFPQRHAGIIDLGLIRLQPGIDPESVRAGLQQVIGSEAQVLTRDEFRKLEIQYWQKATPIGVIFSAGTVVGFFIGFIVVYQILYTDVTNHLPQFATMKAMGFSGSYLVRVVLGQSFWLAILGYIPGTIVAGLLYLGLRSVTQLPLELSLLRGIALALATLFMCALSGLLAIRKLSSADPADVF